MLKKADLLKAITEIAPEKVTQAQAGAVLDALVAVTHSALKAGHDVAIPELGKFSTSQKAERQGRNPSTGEPITISARVAAKFTPAKALKDTLN